MIQNDYKEGLEISGTIGWSAPLAGFDYNQWISTRDNSHNYQTNSGTNPHPNPPADGYWDPAPAPGNLGGVWYTCVTGAGC